MSDETLTTDTDCPVCAKHQGRGPLVSPLVWADDTVVVTHRPVDPATGRGVLGYVFVETRRHVERWQDLTPGEVSAVADAAWRVARALARRFRTGHVFTAVIGLGVPHFHQHVLVRHPGTPDEVPWFESGSWDGAPTGTAAEVQALTRQL